MYSIRIIGLISVLAGGVLNQAQQLKTVTATPADLEPTVSDLFPARNVSKEAMEGAYGGLRVRFNDRY
jgi:hypothetical protein